MLKRECRELTREFVRGLIEKHLKPKGKISARPLPTNNYERHKNWKVVADGHAYLLRMENPFTNKVRKMFLKDEIAVLKLLRPYRVAPKLLTHGKYNNRPFLIEEWIGAPRLDTVGRLTNTHYKKIIRFIARVNSIPIGRLKKKFRFKEDRLDRLAERKNNFENRIRAGRRVKEFREIIQEILPMYREGFAELARRVRALPKSVWRYPVLSYRDISRTNLMATQPNYTAIDWEWHSIGIADPSLSLVVFMQRFNLLGKRAWILEEYRHLCSTPHLDELVETRILERLLGGLTWSLGWTANMKRVYVPRLELQKAIRGGIKNIRERKQELEIFLKNDKSE